MPRMQDPASFPDVSRVCSVYREQEGLYDYYLVDGPPLPAMKSWNNLLGVDILSALPRLPSNARKVGIGMLPAGTIVIGIRTSRWRLGELVLGAAVAGAVSALVSGFLRR